MQESQKDGRAYAINVFATFSKSIMHDHTSQMVGSYFGGGHVFDDQKNIRVFQSWVKKFWMFILDSKRSILRLYKCIEFWVRMNALDNSCR